MVKLGRLVTLLLCATMLTMSSASAQFRGDDEDLRTQLRHVLGELQLLRAEIKEFKERVAALEARDSGKDEPRPQRTPTRDPVTQQELLMQIEGIRAGAAGEVDAARVEALREEAAELTERARKADEEANRLDLYPWYTAWPYTTAPPWWYSDRDRRRLAEAERRQLRTRLRKEAVKYRSEAKKKEGMAIRLERDAREMRQVIWGWNGRRTVFLESERDLSGALRACTAGAFVTWKGRLTERDEFSETWSVTSIDAVEVPPGFRPRPPDSPRPGEDPGGPGAEGSEAGG